MKHFPPKASEYATTTILLLWCLIMSLSTGQSPIYAGMGNQKLWVVVFGGLSVFRLLVLYINGNLRHSPHLRAVLALLTCFAWFQLTLTFLSAEFISTALAVYPVLLALDFYNGYRIAVEARITDESYKNAGTNT